MLNLTYTDKRILQALAKSGTPLTIDSIRRHWHLYTNIPSRMLMLTLTKLVKKDEGAFGTLYSLTEQGKTIAARFADRPAWKLFA